MIFSQRTLLLGTFLLFNYHCLFCKGYYQQEPHVSDSAKYRLLYNKAVVSSQKKQIDSAIVYFKESIRFATNISDSINTYTDLAWAYCDKGETDSTKFYSQINLTQWNIDSLSSMDKRLVASGVRALRWVYYGKADYFKTNEQSLLEESIFEKDKANHPGLPFVYLNQSIERWRLSDYEKSAQLAQKAIDSAYLLPSQRVKYFEARAYIMLGLVSREIGFYDRALEYYKTALPRTQNNQRSAFNYDIDHIANLINIANIYVIKDKYREAIEYYNRADSYMEKNSHNPTYPIHKTNLLKNIGRAYLHSESYDTAKRYYIEALDLATERLEENTDPFADLYVGLGEYYIKTGNYQEGVSWIKKALALKNSVFGKHNIHASHYYLTLGRAHNLMGDPTSAFTYFDSAILSHPILELASANVFINPNDAIEASMEQLDLIDEIDQSPKTKLDQIDSIYTRIRQHANHSFIQNTDSKDHLNDLFAKIFNGLMLIQNDSKLPGISEMLWEISENDKSRRLIAHLNEKRAIENSVPIEIRFREQVILDSLEYYLYANSKDTANAKYKLLEYQSRYERLTAEIEKNYPEFYRLKYDRVVPSIENVQNMAKENEEAIIEFYLTDSTLYIIAINDSDFQIASTPIDDSLKNHIDTFREQIQAKPSREASKNYIISASSLYKKLILPIERIFDNRKLIIVPSGKLNLIPFDALLSHEVKFQDEHISYSELPYLIKKVNISYATSISHLMKLRGGKKTYSDVNILALAPSFQRGQSRSGEASPKLTNLTWSKKEIQMISTHFSTKLITDTRATESKFKSELLNNQYTIAHIASHAIVDIKDPLYSRVIFSDNNIDSLDDGYLHTFELINSKNSLEMAVLSSCNSGYGTIQKGEGIMSLAQGFYYSGVKSVVMSQWPANDLSTSEVMHYFYQNLAAGQFKGEALRNAKLEFLEKSDNINAHPFFWAQFILSGDTSPIVSKKFNYWYPVIPLLFILLFFLKQRLKRLSKANF